jgi:phosphoribosyl 1,2-cyclic phosphodiesterase
MKLKFWGVRGSIPTPEASAMTYGGNTPCIEIRYGNLPPLILDAGSGARRLGQSLMRAANSHPAEAYVLFSHFHWDHIQGLPFFAPLYEQDSVVKFYSSEEPSVLKAILQNQMQRPYFPVDLPAPASAYEYCRIDAEGMPWGDVWVKPFPLCHPGRATGYRIQSPDGCIVYASDHEHGDESYDAVVRDFARGADILIYDAQYTPAEYPAHRGWGHSTWLAGVQIAEEAGVRQLALFHHDPGHDDPMLDEIVARASERFANTMAAREGSEFRI